MSHDVENEARALTKMLDSGNRTEQVANALREDSYNMSPSEFSRMVTAMQRHDRRGVGDDLYRDNNGNLVIDTGSTRLLVATREFDDRRSLNYYDQRGRERQWLQQQHGYDWEQRERERYLIQREREYEMMQRQREWEMSRRQPYYGQYPQWNQQDALNYAIINGGLHILNGIINRRY